MHYDAMSDDAIAEEIGHRIERMRLERNLTQQFVADEVGLSRVSYAKLEKGACKLENLIAVLRVLGQLDNLDQFIPEAPLSPLALLKLKGQQRQRATGIRAQNETDKNQNDTDPSVAQPKNDNKDLDW